MFTLIQARVARETRDHANQHNGDQVINTSRTVPDEVEDDHEVGHLGDVLPLHVSTVVMKVISLLYAPFPTNPLTSLHRRCTPETSAALGCRSLLHDRGT